MSTQMQTDAFEQTEAFPPPLKTRRELAEEFLEHFQADVEAAEKSLVNARVKLHNAIVLRDDAEENLRRAINAADDEATDEAGDSTMQIGPAPQAEDAEYVEVDPITGEVAPTCDTPPCVVAVFDPGPAEEPVATVVGDRTTYGELAADYITASGFTGDVLELAVVNEEDGMPRRRRDVIDPRDYGERFLVVVLEDSPLWMQCPVCDGDGRQPDKSGGGHHGTCEECQGLGCVECEARAEEGSKP